MTTVNCFPMFGGPSSQTETRQSQKKQQNILFLII